jgi:molecular chaperone HscC
MRAPITRALRDSSLSPEKIGEVLLVGGSTRMPVVARLATQLFGRLPLRSLPPDEAIALGAAVQAALKAGDAEVGDMVVTDVAPFTLGTSTSEKLGAQLVSGIFCPIIERGTVIPVSRTKSFTTISDFQERVTFNVYQGEHSLCKDNKKLGEYVLGGLRPLPAGEEDIDVRFTYDLNGILEVDMTIVHSGKTETLVIEGAPGRLSAEQIKKARDEMQRLKFHPRDALPNTTLLTRADALFVELVGVDRESLGHAIATFRAALEAQDDHQIATTRERLQYLVNKFRR